jgi:ABC-type polysaccharide/polyol phosphate transport system ATPase subunit
MHNSKVSSTSVHTDKKISIQLDHVTLDYPLRTNLQGSLKGLLSFQKDTHPVLRMQRALENVNLSIYHGDILGVIGANGAGKSTLLKLLAQIIRPSQGSVKVWGEVFPLLTLGAGFHMDLTGVENIYLYSSILGRSKKDVDRNLDWIIQEAELEEEINRPISTYSKGMIARLGFFTIMSERPDILLADEVLGVGDERFRDKCNNLLRDAYQASTTTIIVSHSMPLLRKICNRIIWIKEKGIHMDGDPSSVTQHYQQFMHKNVGPAR